MPSEVQAALQKTREENRTALVISSVESKFEMVYLRELVQAQKVVYLRDYELQWRGSSEGRVICMSDA